MKLDDIRRTVREALTEPTPNRPGNFSRVSIRTKDAKDIVFITQHRYGKYQTTPPIVVRGPEKWLHRLPLNMGPQNSLTPIAKLNCIGPGITVSGSRIQW